MSRMPTQLAEQTVRRRNRETWVVSMIQVHEPRERVEIVAFGPRCRQIELNTTNFANALLWIEQCPDEIFESVFQTKTLGFAKPESHEMILTTHSGLTTKAQLLE